MSRECEVPHMKQFIVEKITMKPTGIHGKTAHTEIESVYVARSKVSAIAFIKGVAFSHVSDSRFVVNRITDSYCYMLTTLFDSAYTVITEYISYDKDEFESFLDDASEDSISLFGTENENEAIANIGDVLDGYYDLDKDIKDCIFINL